MKPKNHLEKARELEQAFQQQTGSTNTTNMNTSSSNTQQQLQQQTTGQQEKSINIDAIIDPAKVVSNAIREVEMSGMLLEMEPKTDVSITAINNDTLVLGTMPEELQRAQQAAYDAQIHLLNENQKLQQALFQLHQSQERVRQLQQQVQSAQQQVQITQAAASTIVNNLAK